MLCSQHRATPTRRDTAQQRKLWLVEMVFSGLLSRSHKADDTVKCRHMALRHQQSRQSEHSNSSIPLPPLDGYQDKHSQRIKQQKQTSGINLVVSLAQREHGVEFGYRCGAHE
ncbi:hypothetical protein VTN00DRAFT_453 [Thermoascus crustaceus]|uniref:uncharacterized protein n=1 Tax=Thermoascus crustaceus TaxID=5088 RepID=UPI0037444EEB